jgi:hypothetical protein
LTIGIFAPVSLIVNNAGLWVVHPADPAAPDGKADLTFGHRP